MWQQITRFFKRIDLRKAVKTAIAAGCSFTVANAYSTYFARPDILASGLWCVVATIVVMQANIGSTYKAGGIRFVGSIIGSLIGGICTYYLGATSLTLGLNVAATILICSILRLQDAYRIAALSGAVVMLSWAVHPEAVTPWEIGFFRSLDASVGIIIAIIVSHMVWPEQTWLNLQKQFITAIQIAKTYFHDAVEISETNEIEKGRELGELLNMLTKLRIEVEENKLEIFSFNNNGNEWLSVIRDFDILVESIAIVEEIPKENLNNIFDETLKWHVGKFIEECQMSFDELQIACLRTPLTSERETADKIPENEQLLVKELERFRETHVTRHYSLSDVENLYSFFYHLRFIAKLLRKIKRQLELIQSPV